MVIDLKGMIAGALLERYGETPLAKIAISVCKKVRRITPDLFASFFG